MSNIFSPKYVPVTSAAIFTTNEVPGRTIEQTFGLVALLSEGGLGTTSNNLPQLMEACLDKATELGANAIIAFRYDANEIQKGVTEVIAYGTAVIVEK